jgi:hypothetical protein
MTRKWTDDGFIRTQFEQPAALKFGIDARRDRAWLPAATMSGAVYARSHLEDCLLAVVISPQKVGSLKASQAMTTTMIVDFESTPA